MAQEVNVKEQGRTWAGGAANIDDPVSAQATPEQWRSLIRHSGSSGGQPFREAGVALLLGVAAALLALVTFAFLADGVLDYETHQLDQGVLVWLHQFSSPQMTLAATGVSTFGSELVVVFGVALLVWFGVRRRWGAAASLLLIVGGAQLLNDVLKSTVHRARPTPVGATLLGQAYSFPSGHAMMSAAFYTFVAYLGWRLLSGSARVLWVAAMVLIVLLVGLARLYLEVHYLTDVLAGYLAGFIWADAVLIGGHLLARRRTEHALEPST